MKKSIALVALAFGVTSAFAQDLTSKKGEPILPEADDWAVGIDATPFLNYAGNFFGKGGNASGAGSNQAPTVNFLNSNQTITLKMFKDAQNAYRAAIRLGFGGPTERNMVTAMPTATVSYPTQEAQVENKWKRSNTNIGISVGMEKRRGKTRLQGFYGADVGIWFSSMKDKFTYGNTLTASSTASLQVDVNSADAFTGANNVSTTAISNDNANGARITTRKFGSTFEFGLRAFIGAEYFIMPKVSLGGEFGWGLGYSMTGKSKTTWESIGTPAGATAETVGTTEIVGAKSGSFVIDTDNQNSVFGPSGTLKATFHF